MTQTTLATLTLLAVTTAASAQIQLTIAVEPPATLPGIVPSLRVQARNIGSSPAEVPSPAALSVTVPGQEPFLAGAPGPGNHLTLDLPDQGSDRIVAPGESRDFTFWTAGSFLPAWFVSDARLTRPGTYRLQLIAGAEFGQATFHHDVESRPRPASIPSNEVAYRVLEPQRDDADVWALMRNLSALSSWPGQLGAQIWRDHPESTYAAYCTPRVEPFDADTEIARYEAALKKKPDPVTGDAYRLTIAEFHLEREHRAIINRDLATALHATAQARELLVQVAREASDPQVRERAAATLRAEVRTREQLIEAIEAVQGRYPNDVRPSVDCIEKLEDGSSVIWFAYQNPSRNSITENVGPRNKITPPPFDRAQPTTFRTGVHHLVFSIPVTTAPELTWHLQKSQLIVKVRDVPICSAEDLILYRQWHPEHQ